MADNRCDGNILFLSIFKLIETVREHKSKYISRVINLLSYSKESISYLNLNKVKPWKLIGTS